jgi:hypothetical protein
VVGGNSLRHLLATYALQRGLADHQLEHANSGSGCRSGGTTPRGSTTRRVAGRPRHWRYHRKPDVTERATDRRGHHRVAGRRRSISTHHHPVRRRAGPGHFGPRRCVRYWRVRRMSGLGSDAWRVSGHRRDRHGHHVDACPLPGLRRGTRRRLRSGLSSRRSRPKAVESYPFLLRLS